MLTIDRQTDKMQEISSPSFSRDTCFLNGKDIAKEQIQVQLRIALEKPFQCSVWEV